MGSGMDEHAERAVPLGRWLAKRGVHLLTGAGRGVMASVSKAFFETPDRQGLVLGVVPCEPGSSRARAGYPNQWVEVPIFTHLPLTGASGTEVGSRNHINVLSSSVIVALPGGQGTASEASLAVRYGKPIVAFVTDHREAENLPSQVQTCRTLEAVCAFIDQRLLGHYPGPGRL